jgi:hypothetical protein
MSKQRKPERLKTTVYLDPLSYRELKRLGRLRGWKTASMVREAVMEYAAKHAPRARRPRSVGAFASGKSNLSERAEDLLKGMGR